MKTFKNILALTVLFAAFVLNAEPLSESRTLRDGTVIPAGSEMVLGADGSVQFSADGVILAQVKTTTTANGSVVYEIVRRKAGGGYERITVGANGAVISGPVDTAAPAPVTPADPGGAVSGSPNVIAPNGIFIPDSPASVV